MPATTLTFAKAGKAIIGSSRDHSLFVFDRRFRSHFGLTPKVALFVWKRITHTTPQGFQPKHLLWGLLFLKCYHTEHVNSTLTAADEKTFRKWSWAAVHALSNLGLIQWQRRLQGRCVNGGYISLDGTDFRIQEPTPFDSSWYCFKFHGAGLRYEVGLCIDTGHIVWLHGPFPCGAYNDLRIFRERLKHDLLQGEKIVAGRGYWDLSCITPFFGDE